MGGHRFDDLVRALRVNLSRRETLTVLGAALSSSTLLSVRPEQAAALTRKQRRRCRRHGGAVCSAGTQSSQCCSLMGECVNGACGCDQSTSPCPNDATGQCQCVSALGGVPACARFDDPCNEGRSCTTNADCDPGTVCSFDCQVPAGSLHCTNPCVPV
jgi:hypothetical protein